MTTRRIHAVWPGLILTGCAATGGPPPMAFDPAARPVALSIGANPEDFVPVGFPQYPALSPDGSLLVYSWAGDLWLAPATGGPAARLTSHPAFERRSAFSPDGSHLAFESDRDGTLNLYVMPVDTRAGAAAVAGAIRRVTVSDRPQTLSGWSADGKSLLFSADMEPSIFNMPRMYAVPIAGGPARRLTDAHGALPRAAMDGSFVVFQRGNAGWERPAYRGSGAADLWRLNLPDGSFTRLTTLDANDGDATPLPDGSVLFVSSRDGQNNVHRQAAGRSETDGASAITRLTSFAPAADQLTIGHGVRDLSASADGRRAVFVVWDTIFTLDLTDPAARPVAIGLSSSGDRADLDTARVDVSRLVSEAALSPDGKTVAVVARGEVFVRNVDEGRPARRVTATYGRERDLAWSPDGRWLYFASDDSGRYAIYRAGVSLAREDLQPKKTEPAEPAAPADPPQTPAADPEPQPPATPDPASEPAGQPAAADPPAQAPPSGAQPADAAKADAKNDEAKKADAKNDEAKKDEAKKDESKPDYGKRWAESLRFEVSLAHEDPSGLRVPQPSPDGRWLLATSGRGDLVLFDRSAGTRRVILESWNFADVQWFPDSRHLVYSVSDLDFNDDIWVIDALAEGAAPVNVTRHPDLDYSPRLSADGKVLTFLSDRSGDNFESDVWRVNLDRGLDGLPAYELDQYFKDAADKAKKRKPIDPVDPEATPGDAAEPDAPKDGSPATAPAGEAPALDLDDAYLRVRRLSSIPGGHDNLAVTPGGDRILFTASVDGSTGLFSVDHKGQDRKSVQASAVSGVSVSLTGDKAVFVRSGEAAWGPPSGGKVDALSISAAIDLRIADQQRQKFLEAARIFGEEFYHPTLKGLDWPRLTDRYLPLAMQTRTSAEFNRVVQQLFGEVNGSHTGIGGGGSFTAAPAPVGYLGIDAAPAETGYRVVRVIPDSPAAQKNSLLEPGDVITAVDGTPLADGTGLTDLAAALAGAAGRETLLDVTRADPDLPGRVLITPWRYAQDDNARYTDEVNRRAALVDRLSGGRLGYLHIRGMSEPSVRDFERDLFATASGKAGLIIDVRDNGGGSTADVLLASLTAPRHAYTIPRGADPSTVPPDAYPRDRRLIYGYTRPISVLINQNSFSNAEIFAHAVKTIGRGRLVGTATFGGVISTGGASLIDGTTIRTPFRGWYLPDGRDMENHGARPDLDVPQTPDAEAAGRDPQLEAAVAELLERAGP